MILNDNKRNSMSRDNNSNNSDNSHKEEMQTPIVDSSATYKGLKDEELKDLKEVDEELNYLLTKEMYSKEELQDLSKDEFIEIIGSYHNLLMIAQSKNSLLLEIIIGKSKL